MTLQRVDKVSIGLVATTIRARSLATVENDMDKLERIVGQEYTLAANNFPGGRTRLGSQEWMETVPAYEVHSYEFADVVVAV